MEFVFVMESLNGIKNPINTAVMSKISEIRNEYQDYPPYRSYKKRNYSYSLSHDKFVVPWQMGADNPKSKNFSSKTINVF